jgi:hypothetical protein
MFNFYTARKNLKRQTALYHMRQGFLTGGKFAEQNIVKRLVA